jgi:hypothetical protein
MNSISTILILAITVEALIEYTKLIFVDHQINWKQIVSLIIGIAIAVLSNIDLFSIVGVTFIVPYVGCVLTGIIFSRGSNYVADFITLIQGKRVSKINELNADEMEIEVGEDTEE